MRLILFDPANGAAGDMITAALLDAGADREAVLHAIGAIVRKPEISQVTRGGVLATYIQIHAEDTTRSFDEVIDRLNKSDASEQAKAMAKRVFERICDAETRVHGKHAHFHEVGADDAIADVIGACTALLSLAPDAVMVLPVPLGSGTISSSHGRLPIPAPATAFILEKSGLITRPTLEETGELVTPTGAALLAEFHSIYGILPVNGMIKQVGYGAGTRNPPERPNVLRVMIIEDEKIFEAEGSDRTVDILETNVDDCDGEMIAAAIARLIREGARDASAGPIMMKKGRPGHIIRVICRKEDSERLALVLAEELGTLGIRCINSVHRFIADRTIITIRIPEGDEIEVKIGIWQKKIISVKAEFDAVSRAADRLGLPVREIKRKAEEMARLELEGWKPGA